MVKGIEKMRAKMQTHLKAATAAGKQSAERQSTKLVKAMQFIAPAHEGELIRSIRAEETHRIKTGHGTSEFIGYSVRAGDATTVVTNDSGGRFQNARIQEFGTAERAANPYFYPAWRANRKQIRAAIRTAISRAWKKGAP